MTAKPTETMPELMPCPLCGVVAALDNTWPRSWTHPSNECLLSGKTVMARDAARWNRRVPAAAQPAIER
jgi:hypothetical protein